MQGTLTTLTGNILSMHVLTHSKQTKSKAFYILEMEWWYKVQCVPVFTPINQIILAF